ncbi:GNAT family N-acetyltransferase [Nitrincola alkalisediminis]|nr:GNAT family N-acetyltransferase [Nitrincola alkalisediminis]
MYQVRSIEGISEISAKDWNHLCGQDYPFLRHEFLHALEASSAVSPSTGWTPCHLLMNEGRQLIAVMPMYIKTHSYGEYVFDWVWADAWQRYGLPYYPKLLTAIPFTPATGPRIGTHHPLNKIVPLFIEAIQALGESFNTSGWHGLFTEPELTQIGKDQGLFTRLGTQYHWFNRQYSDFEHYLAHMMSRKRKSIRKERDKISKLNLRIRCLEGHEIDSTALNHFYQFYQITHLKRGRKGYLNRAFFEQIVQKLPEQLMLCSVERSTEVIASALFFKSSTTLFGRYWGATEEIDGLHFETCYYQGIEYAIRHGLQRFDPGAQGEHKIARGFEPVDTWSLHWLAETGFQPALTQFLEEEHQHIRAQQDDLRTYLPFHKNTHSQED